MFCCRNRISPKSERVHESFSFAKFFFSDRKKIFRDFSVGMELENEKTESINENENKENKNVDEFEEYNKGANARKVIFVIKSESDD